MCAHVPALALEEPREKAEQPNCPDIACSVLIQVTLALWRKGKEE
jgi:hypothetical protein